MSGAPAGAPEGAVGGDAGRTPGAEPRPGRRLLLATWLLLLAKTALFVAAAVNTQFVMDEYYLASSLQVPVADLYGAVNPVKTVLSLMVFRLAPLLAHDAVGIMVAARVETAVAALLVVALVVAVARKLGAARDSAWLAGLLLFSFSTYFERAFRIRADSLALLLGVAAWHVSLGPGARRQRALAAGVLAGGAFASTQKSAYVILALGLGLVVTALRRDGLRRALEEGALLVAGWASVLLAYAIAFGGTAFTAVLHRVFASPARLMADAAGRYANLSQYLSQTYDRNQLAYLTCAFGLLATVRSLRARPEIAGAWVTTLVVTGLVVRHPQPWPYVLVTPLPFLAAWGGRVLDLAPRDRRGAVAVAVLAIAGWSFVRNVRYLGHSNAVQNRVVREAERLLGPEDRYLDGTGMVPSRRQSARVWWDTPKLGRWRAAAERGDLSSFEQAFEGRPKVFILTYRSDKVADLLEPFLAESYVRVGSNLLLSGIELRSGEATRFVNRWPGEYDVRVTGGLDVGVVLEVDGRPVTAPVTLDVGVRELVLGGAVGRAWLLPSDAPRDLELGADLPRAELFPLRYSY